MSGLDQSSSSQKTINWLRSQERRQERQSIFCVINKKTIERIEQSNVRNREISSSKKDLMRLQQKVDETIKRKAEETQKLKQKLGELRKQIVQSQRRERDREGEHSKKIKQIRSRVEMKIKGLKYKESFNLIDYKQHYSKVISLFNSSLEGILKNNSKEKLLTMKEELTKEVAKDRSLLSNVKQQKEQQLRTMMNDSEQRLLQLKKRVLSIDSQKDEIVQQLQHDIKAVESEIEVALKEQRYERQDNKEKILSLFQFKFEEIMKKRQFQEKMNKI